MEAVGLGVVGCVVPLGVGHAVEGVSPPLPVGDAVVAPLLAAGAKPSSGTQLIGAGGVYAAAAAVGTLVDQRALVLLESYSSGTAGSGAGGAGVVGETGKVLVVGPKSSSSGLSALNIPSIAVCSGVGCGGGSTPRACAPGG